MKGHKVKGSSKENISLQLILFEHICFLWNRWEQILPLDWQRRAFDYTRRRTSEMHVGLHKSECVQRVCMRAFMCRLYYQTGFALRVPRGSNACKAALHWLSVTPKPTAHLTQGILFQNSAFTPTACNLFDTTANLNAPSYSCVLSVKTLHLFLAVAC